LEDVTVPANKIVEVPSQLSTVARTQHATSEGTLYFYDED